MPGTHCLHMHLNFVATVFVRVRTDTGDVLTRCVDMPVHVQLVFCSSEFYIALFYAFC